MIVGVDQQTILTNARSLSIGEVAQLGSTVVMTPHPDDESLGCGGLITLLRQAGQPVHLVFVSDGSMSHPNSRQYPAQALRQLRESEAVEAAACLGVAEKDLTFLRLPDTRVPTPGSPDFEAALNDVTDLLNRLRPDTVLLPWRRDPHRDHRAVYRLSEAALQRTTRRPRRLEYPVWLWELGTEADRPQPGEVEVRRLDVGPVLPQKQRAIAAHRSQVTRLIDDDPEGFWLSPDLLRYFNEPFEVFFEAIT